MITYAQEITVTGKVTAGGEEMPGVTVAVKGQTRGTSSTIWAASFNSTLITLRLFTGIVTVS